MQSGSAAESPRESGSFHPLALGNFSWLVPPRPPPSSLIVVVERSEGHKWEVFRVTPGGPMKRICSRAVGSHT